MAGAEEVLVGTTDAPTKPRIRPIVFLAGCVPVLGCASYFKPEPYRAFYGGLAAFFAFAIIVQCRRETIFASNHSRQSHLLLAIECEAKASRISEKVCPRSNMSSSPSIEDAPWRNRLGHSRSAI